MKNRITQYKISNLPFKEQLYSGVGLGDNSFPRLNILASRQCFTCYFRVCHDKRSCYKRCRMQSLDHVEVKIFLCEDFLPVLTVPLQRGTGKLSTGRKVESGVHQCTHFISQCCSQFPKWRHPLTTVAIHPSIHPSSWDRAPDLKTVINIYNNTRTLSSDTQNSE